MMKTELDCIVCVYKQALNTSRLVSNDPAMHLEIMNRVAEIMRAPDLDQTPAVLCKPLYEIVSAVSGVRDPFAKVKHDTNTNAMKLLPELLDLVHKAPDPLKAACHLAVAGNIIDLGIGHQFDLENDVRAILHRDFAIDAYNEFRRELAPGKRALYLGDNSGEIVFDRVLIEFLLDLGVRPTFVVKSAPIINDATMDDARFCGLTELVPVIETGSDDIGIHWGHVSDEFRDAFAAADFVIGKGHGNFETCTGHPGNFYFLLKAKCAIVAAQLGVRLGDIVFTHEPR